MSSSAFPKIATIGDSNIPVPRRTHAASKRSAKGCAQLPELQKYIETIIKASNECDSEETLLSEKGNRFPKQRKFGRYSVCKGNDNPTKNEKVKFDLQVTARKSKNKAKTPYPEAVSSGDEIPNMIVYTDFEDPRNWKTDDQNLGSKSEIENFLKQLFPNPYHLENVNGVQNINSDIAPEKKQEDDLGDETVAHVPISDVRTETEVESEKTNNAIVIADSEIKPCKRGSNVNCRVGATSSLEHCIRPESRMGGCRESPTNANPNRVSTPSKTPPRNRSSHSTLIVSSKGSSLESVSEVFGSQNETIVSKTSSKVKCNAVSKKSSQNEMKRNSSGEDFSDEAASDYDIGKLKLLSMTDSDESFSKNLEQSKDACDDYLMQTPSTAFDDVYESDDLNDLRQIFEVMNKATESFFELSLKTERNSVFDIPKDTTGNDKLLEFVTELSEREAVAQQSAQDEKNIQKDKWDEKGSEKCCTEQEETERGEENAENGFANSEEVEDKKAAEGGLMNFLLREEREEMPENTESTKPEKEKISEDTQLGPYNGDAEEGSSRHEEVTNTCFILSDLEQVDSAEEDQEAGQKIDEVLQFMYNCLKKFSNQEKEHLEGAENFLLEDREEVGKSKMDLTNAAQEQTKSSRVPKNSYNTSNIEELTENMFVESYPRVKEIQSESSTFLDDTKRKPVMRARCRKRQDKNSPLAISDMPPPVSRLPPNARGLETHSTTDSPATVQTVEGQNELGSYSEQPPLSSFSDPHTVKPILPHSVKLKKSKTDTQKTIKDVLDTEEKLLANYLSSKPPEKKAPEKSGDSRTRKSGNHMVVRSGRTTTYSFLNDIRRSNSNFVICVSSLPRNLRTMAANRTSLTLSPSLSLSLSNVSKMWDIKPIPYYQRFCLKKIPVIFDIAQSVLQLSYNIRQGALLTVGRSHVVHVARPVCLGRTVSYTKSEEDLSLKTSECLISIRVKPMKKSLFVESSGTSRCLIRPLAASNSDFTDGGTSVETEGNQRVDSLLEALEKTHGRLMLLEQNEFITSESLSSCSGIEACKCDNSEIDWEGESGHEKVQDLLLRTYSLQQKLHRYLYKMTCVQSASAIASSLTQQERSSHLNVIVNDQSDSKIQQEKNASKPEKATKAVADEAITVEVQTSDHAISYSPPSEQSKQTSQNSTEPETKDVEEDHDTKNEDDDNSSVCSFKSSNDFSEPNEVMNLENKSKLPEKAKSGEFLKKIFSEIESFRQSFKTIKKDNPSSVENKHESSENLKENRLTEYDPKMPAKVLKTVFRGQKSMTELTIGLKDVPMTQVSNISVEKRKFSPNHTKISICILKEKPEALEKANTQDSMFKANSDILHNKLSTLYFDQIRPSLSRCRTEYSRMEDDLSKTSDSVNETSEDDDDDDDDFKSVASNLSSPDVTNEQKETKETTRTPTPPPPPKTFTKYRFDFYRKMDMSIDSNQSKPKPPSTVCRPYKELEPLKQALTEMQIRMRSIKQDTFYSSNDYYERALRLAKMSAGYCQSCGNRAVIPKDTFGYYKTLLPRRYSNHRNGRPFKMAATPSPSYYSIRSTNREVGDSFCDLDIKHSSSYLLNHRTRPSGAFLRNSLHDMPILIERM